MSQTILVTYRENKFDTVVTRVEVVAQTERAWKVSAGNKWAWFPISVFDRDTDDDATTPAYFLQHWFKCKMSDFQRAVLLHNSTLIAADAF